MNNTAEQKKAERIRNQYVKREDSKIEQLQKLDAKVKTPGKVTASIIGGIGALVMGGGMSLIMEMEKMQLGLMLGIPGLIVALLAYPIYSLITNSRKKKFKDEIISLSDEVIIK